MMPTTMQTFMTPEAKRSVFKLLSAEELEELEGHYVRTHIKKNDYIYKEGDSPVGFIALEEGKVKIFKEGIGGREQIVRMVKPGGFVGYRSLITGECHQSSAVAFEDSIIITVDAGHFIDKLMRNYNFSMRIVTKLAKELGFSNKRTVTLTQKHIRGRLAESLLLLKEKYGLEPDGLTVKAYLSREDLANLSNMTTSNAIRTLSTFVNERIIAIDGRKVRLLNEDELEKISRLG